MCCVLRSLSFNGDGDPVETERLPFWQVSRQCIVAVGTVG